MRSSSPDHGLAAAAELRAVHADLVQLERDCIEVEDDLGDPCVERLELAESTARFGPRVRALMDRTADILRVIPPCCSADGQPAPEQAAAATAADLAHLASLELNQLRANLDAVSALDDSPRVLSRFADLTNRLFRTVYAAERALRGLVAGAQPTPVLEILRGHLRRSLMVRDAYSAFRATVAAIAPRAEDVRCALQAVESRISALFDSDAYRAIRITDRLEFREIQRSIEGWRRSGGSAEDGLALWQDVRGLASLLSLVNDRSEIVLHDAVRILAALESLWADPSPTVARTVGRDLRPLVGVVPELDEVLGTAEPAALVDALTRGLTRIKSRSADGLDASVLDDFRVVLDGEHAAG